MVNGKLKQTVCKITSGILTAVISFSVMPVITGNYTVSADVVKNADNTCLGTMGLSYPQGKREYYSAPNQLAYEWSGSYVYFGSKNGNPYKFRVLSPNTSAYGGSTLFLDCAGRIPARAFDSDSNDWATSDLKAYLNEEFLTDGPFTKLEQSAIAPSYADAHELVVGNKAGQVPSKIKERFGNYVALTGEKIFVLDAEEASNSLYGYGTENGYINKTAQYDYWWLRSADETNSAYVGAVQSDQIEIKAVSFPTVFISPALNIDRKSIFSCTGVSGGAKLTLIDSDLNISVTDGESISLSGERILIPYTISGNDADQYKTKKSIVILDKPYTECNTNNARILYYFTDTSNGIEGNMSFTFPSSINMEYWGKNFYVYIIAENINGEKETDYASVPVELAAPAGVGESFSPIEKTVDNTFLGTSGIASPSLPVSYISSSGVDSVKWYGSYVYYGYRNDKPIKFRVLAPSTTAYGGTTMFLDCNELLFSYRFDRNSNEWKTSALRSYLNSTFYYSREFSDVERASIFISVADSHELVAGEGAGRVSSAVKSEFGNYVGLTGEKIFILDAEEASNIQYGYTATDGRLKVYGNTWWLRSASKQSVNDAGFIEPNGQITTNNIENDDYDSYKAGVSPAFNVDLNSILFSTAVIGKKGEPEAEYKLTLIDNNLDISVSKGQQITVSDDSVISVPYFISGYDANEVTQLSVMVLDKEFTAGNTTNASLLYYDSIKNMEPYNVSGIVSFALPDAFDLESCGTDFYIYILAEVVNIRKQSDYSSEPLLIEIPSSVEVKNGWIQDEEENYYYYVDGEMLKGMQNIDGLWYCFDDSTGVMLTGWVQYEGVWYYMNPDNGARVSGWLRDGEIWYYMDHRSGAMSTGWKTINGDKFYFLESGAMATGWHEIRGIYYFFKQNGCMASEEYCNGYWLGKDGTWTYKAKAIWKKDSKGWYYIDSYYWYPKSQWLKIDGIWYYFKSDGYAAANEYCNGYWFNADGAWKYQYVASWKKDSTGWWYGDTSGWYAKNQTLKIDGKNYNFNSRGYCTNP